MCSPSWHLHSGQSHNADTMFTKYTMPGLSSQHLEPWVESACHAMSMFQVPSYLSSALLHTGISCLPLWRVQYLCFEPASSTSCLLYSGCVPLHVDLSTQMIALIAIAWLPVSFWANAEFNRFHRVIHRVVDNGQRSFMKPT